jgi:hypothetical protein
MDPINPGGGSRMSESAAVFGNIETKLTLYNFDLWYGRSGDDGFTLDKPLLDYHMPLSQALEEDDFDIGDTVSVDGMRVLDYEEYGRGMDSRYLRDIYQIARIFKKREWGVVLLTFDGPHSPLDDKVSIGPDVGPLLEGDVKEIFTEAVAVYLGPQLDKGPYADYGRILVPLSYPYMAPQNWESKSWEM